MKQRTIAYGALALLFALPGVQMLSAQFDPDAKFVEALYFAPMSMLQDDGGGCLTVNADQSERISISPRPYGQTTRKILQDGSLVSQDESPIEGEAGCVYFTLWGLDPADAWEFKYMDEPLAKIAWDNLPEDEPLLFNIDPGVMAQVSPSEGDATSTVNSTPAPTSQPIATPLPVTNFEPTVQAQATVIAVQKTTTEAQSATIEAQATSSAAQEATIAAQATEIATLEAQLASETPSSRSKTPDQGADSTDSDQSGDSYTIEGTFTLWDEDVINIGSRCSGTGGYSDIGDGTQIIVRDGDGKLLGSGRLTTDADESSNHMCVYTFSIEVPEAEFYVLSMGRRGEMVYTFDELEDVDWKVDLRIS